MDEHQLDAIIVPQEAQLEHRLAQRRHYHIGSSSPAWAGYPNITVPMGNIHGLRWALHIWRAWSEPTLIEIAYGFEQKQKHVSCPP